MADFLHPFSMNEMFEPNCRVTVTGEHFFFDKKLYSNIYGIAFFSAPDEYGNNPHISQAVAGHPSILDEFLNDGMHHGEARVNQDFEIRQNIMKNVDKRFLTRPEQKTITGGGKRLSCSFDGNISFHGEDTIMLMYGSVLPATVLITESAVTLMLPFSPFPTLSFMKGKRILQTTDYPYRASPFEPPEDVAIDFATYTNALSLKLNEDMTGILNVDYYLEVGASKCENAKFTIEFSPLSKKDEASVNDTERTNE